MLLPNLAVLALGVCMLRSLVLWRPLSGYFRGTNIDGVAGAPPPCRCVVSFATVGNDN